MEPKCHPHQKKMMVIVLSSSFTLLLLLNSARLTAADSASNIKNFCNHTGDSSGCQSQFSSANKQDPYSALEVAVNILIKEVNSAIDKAKKLQPGARDLFAAHGFSNCVVVFSDAVSDLQSAKDAIKARDVKSIGVNLRAAGMDLGFCGPGFRVNYMAQYCHNLDQMLGYCRLIAAEIK